MKTKKISQKFKCRCSSIGELMTGTIGLTDAQSIKLDTYRARHNDPTQKPLTVKMMAEMNDLIEKRDNPKLPETPKTLARDWFLSKKYDKKKTFSTKETEKGNLCEEDAIILLSDAMDWGLCWGNSEHFSNSFIQGTPDLFPNDDLVVDIKCPWSIFTMPFFDTKPDPGYYGQLQGYMHLTGRKKSILAYCLMDLPERMAEEMALKKLRYDKEETRGFDEIYHEIYMEHQYSHLPRRQRLKLFHIDYDAEYIAEVETRVNLLRNYIDEMDADLETMNQDIIELSIFENE